MVLVVLVRSEVHSRNQNERSVEEGGQRQQLRFTEETLQAIYWRKENAYVYSY